MGHDLPDLMRRQHADLRELLDELDRQPAVTELTLQAQLRARRRVLQTVQRRFLAMQAGRLRYLWPALRRAWPDGRSYTNRAWGETRTVEHRMAKRQWLGERDEATTDLDDHIATDIETLLATEERQLARLEGPADRTGLDGTTVARRLRSGRPWPTRPHPDVPRSPWLAAILHRPLAVSDRVLDRCAHEGG